MMRRTSSPAIRPASRVAVRCASLKYAGHRDDRAIDFRINLALLGEERLGAVLQLAQDEGGDLRRRELAGAQSDLDDAARIAGETKREQPRLVADVVDALAHEALHGVDRAAGIGQKTTLGLAPDVYRLILGNRHDRRQQRVAAAIADHDGHAVLHVGDEAVGGAEIDADDFAHMQRASGFGLRDFGHGQAWSPEPRA